jgi:hypothetical protein
MDEEITDQSTKLRNLNSIQSYKWNTTKNMVNTESAHMKVKVHKCYITKSNNMYIGSMKQLHEQQMS